MSSDGLDMSAREMAGLLKRARSGDLSEDEVDQLWQQVSEEQKYRFVRQIVNTYIVPHIVDIRQRARDQIDPEVIREDFAQLSEEEQQEIFEEAIQDVIATLFEIREAPSEGMLKLKGLLRDPYTMEGLLLIFQNDDYIDPEYSESMKRYVAQWITWAGMAIFPEMYDEMDVRDAYEQFGFPVDRLE